jgi:hypothetical protein
MLLVLLNIDQKKMGSEDVERREKKKKLFVM